MDVTCKKEAATCSPPAPGVASPLCWGTEEGLQQLLGHGVVSLKSEPRPALQHYRSVAHAVQVFSTYFGPTLSALEQVGPTKQNVLMGDITAVFHRYNRAGDGAAVMENTYPQTVAVVQ